MIQCNEENNDGIAQVGITGDAKPLEMIKNTSEGIILSFTYHFETMIFGLPGECGAHVFPRVHPLCAFEIARVQRSQPCPLGLEKPIQVKP